MGREKRVSMPSKPRENFGGPLERLPRERRPVVARVLFPFRALFAHQFNARGFVATQPARAVGQHRTNPLERRLPPKYQCRDEPLALRGLQPFGTAFAFDSFCRRVDALGTKDGAVVLRCPWLDGACSVQSIGIHGTGRASLLGRDQHGRSMVGFARLAAL